MANSASSIRAGEAWWEASIKDRTGPVLARIQARLSAFATGVKMFSTATSTALLRVGGALAAIGGGIGAARGGVLGVLANSVSKFIEVANDGELAKSLRTLQAVGDTIKFFVGQALSEPLLAVTKQMIALGIEVAKFINENQALVVSIAAVAVGGA